MKTVKPFEKVLVRCGRSDGVEEDITTRFAFIAYDRLSGAIIALNSLEDGWTQIVFMARSLVQTMRKSGCDVRYEENMTKTIHLDEEWSVPVKYDDTKLSATGDGGLDKDLRELLDDNETPYDCDIDEFNLLKGKR